MFHILQCNEAPAGSESHTCPAVIAAALLHLRAMMFSKAGETSIKVPEPLSSLRPQGVKSFDPACSVWLEKLLYARVCTCVFVRL